ncbi:MAG: PTS transporter subunit EIIA [Bacteroidetes bacterium]|jgi:mannitol/fructose-specific phosphotransferase system IIA component (Ntr-type)|nr:PTS transporter subunit EIIA [Bacteroidota bacterium]
MDIAFMIRDEKSNQPVFPLTVARDGKDVDAQVARGEKMLSHAVVHAAAAEVPVNPVTAIDLNIANGIARSVKEKLGTLVVIGWNGAVSPRQKIFGTILDQLLQEIDEMVFVTKVYKPVNTHSRVVIAVPPFTTLEAGFNGAARSLKMMTDHVGGDLLILSPKERLEYVKKRTERVKPSLDTEFISIPRWSDLPGWLDENIHDDDLFVLMSAREGSISWRPALDRLPRVVAHRYPELSFITVYPSEAEADVGGLSQERNLELLNQERILLADSADNIEQVLLKMLKTEVSVREGDIEKLAHKLLKNSADYSPELMTGVVLFDAHSPLVKSQMLITGIVREGLRVSGTASKAHVILLLISPKEMRVRDHLKGVNTAARMIRPGESLENLMKAESKEDVVSTFMKQ